MPVGTEDLWDIVAAARNGMRTLDLTKQHQLVSLNKERKAEVLAQISTLPPAVECIKLNGIGLDNSHSPMLVEIIKRPATQELWLEDNSLSEAGLVMIAEAVVEGYFAAGSLATLAVGNQRAAAGNQVAAMSTLAITRLLDAMEASPFLTNLRLGEVRDKGLRERHQMIAVANNEALRLRRKAGKYAYSKLHPPTKDALAGELCELELELQDKAGNSMVLPTTAMAARIIGADCSPAILSEKQAPLCCLPPPVGRYSLTFTPAVPQVVQVIMVFPGDIELAPLKLQIR